MPDDSGQYLFSLQDGNYKILEKVGDGGMGIVYRGIDNLMRSVAIKEFSPSQPEKLDNSLLAELKDAFLREARLLANLEHPSLPKIYGYFTEASKLYLVMEYIEGDNLKKQAEELSRKFDGQFSVKKVRQWAKELLEVLIYLHDRDSPIFHRDIKPENLKTRGGRICLLDFGLARGSAGNMSSEATQTIYGFTLRYAPIEQIRGDKTTAKTDLYALAATLYYLLTVEEPADSRIRDRQIREDNPDPLRPIRELRPEVDDRFAEVLMQALAVEAQRRPPSARAMLERLETISPPMPAINLEAPTLHAIKSPLVPSPHVALPAPPTPWLSPAPLPPLPNSPPAPLASPAKPASSSRKMGIIILVGGVILSLLAAAIFIGISKIGGGSSSSSAEQRSSPNRTPSSTDGQPSSSRRKLLARRQLYATPSSDADVKDTLAEGTEVQYELELELTRVKGRFLWAHIISPKEGWVRCAENEEAKSDCVQ